MVKMSSNLADLPLDLLADLIPAVLTSHGQDEFKFGRSTPLVVTSHSQDEFKFGRSTPRSAGRSTPLVLTSYGQDDFKFGRSTPSSAGRSTPVVLKSCGQDDFKFGRSTPRSAGRCTPSSTDILWSRWFQIWQIYPQICWQIYPPVLTSCGQDELKFGRSTPRSAGRSIPPSTDISWSRWVQIWQVYP